MLNKPNIFKSLGHFSQGKVVFDKRLTHPVRDWLFGLLIFTIVIAAGVVQSAHMFVVYRNITADGTADEVLKVHYNQKLVQNTLGVYRQRALQLGEFKNMQSFPVEPSQPAQTAASSTQEEPESPEVIATSSSVQLSQ